MGELVWINGEVMPLAEARVGVEDRGLLGRVYDGPGPRDRRIRVAGRTY